MSILAWDIDRFKSINDAYGHKAGDKVLRVIGQHLARHVRDTDFVGRYGGEEFVMLLVGTAADEARGGGGQDPARDRAARLPLPRLTRSRSRRPAASPSSRARTRRTPSSIGRTARCTRPSRPAGTAA